MLNFDFKEKVLISRKKLRMLYSITVARFVVSLTLLLEILGNVLQFFVSQL